MVVGKGLHTSSLAALHMSSCVRSLALLSLLVVLLLARQWWQLKLPQAHVIFLLCPALPCVSALARDMCAACLQELCTISTLLFYPVHACQLLLALSDPPN